MTEVTIAKTVHTVKEYAFQDCIGITKVNIYKTLAVMGEGVFHRCNKDSYIYIEYKAADIPKEWDASWNIEGMFAIYGWVFF